MLEVRHPDFSGIPQPRTKSEMSNLVMVNALTLGGRACRGQPGYHSTRYQVSESMGGDSVTGWAWECVRWWVRGGLCNLSVIAQ
jgi:hypothetical protein